MNLHPLINPDAKGFQVDDKTAVQQLEEDYTIDEVVAFCRINIFKYSYRVGSEDTDAKKTKTYTAYLTVLKGLQNMGFGSMRVNNAYEFTNTKWRYS